MVSLSARGAQQKQQAAQEAGRRGERGTVGGLEAERHRSLIAQGPLARKQTKRDRYGTGNSSPLIGPAVSAS